MVFTVRIGSYLSLANESQSTRAEGHQCAQIYIQALHAWQEGREGTLQLLPNLKSVHKYQTHVVLSLVALSKFAYLIHCCTNSQVPHGYKVTESSFLNHQPVPVVNGSQSAAPTILKTNYKLGPRVDRPVVAQSHTHRRIQFRPELRNRGNNKGVFTCKVFGSLAGGVLFSHLLSNAQGGSSDLSCMRRTSSLSG